MKNLRFSIILEGKNGCLPDDTGLGVKPISRVGIVYAVGYQVCYQNKRKDDYA